MKNELTQALCALERKNNAVFFIDMDGVLAKWENNGNPNDKGFFLSRRCEKKAKQLVRSLKDDGYNVAILSAVYQNGYAEQEKATWLDNNELGDLPHLFVPYGSDKSEAIHNHAGEKDKFVLLDDYSENLRQWDEAGHLAVKFLNGINNTNGTWLGNGGASISVEMSVEEMKQHLINLIDEQDGNI